jgi:predicted dehydrogenase
VIRWGFLGAGWIARTALAPAVHAADGAVLQAAAARQVERAAALEPAGRSYDDYAALLADDSVDAVYLSLANDAHRPWVLAALKSGKHVLCEKPLGLDAAEARQMARAAQAADRLLVEAVWNRWHPRTRRAEQLLADGAIGTPREVAAAFCFDGVADGNYRLDPAMGGGAWYDVGCYAVAAALWATGRAADASEVTVADAVAEFGPTGVDLTADARFAAAGWTAAVRSGIAREAEQVIRVIGDDGVLELGPGDGDAFTSWHAPSRLVVAGEREVFAPVDPYRLMVEQVSRAIAGAEPPLVGLDHSIAVAELMDRTRARFAAPG